jgi:hypothetical protein
LPVSSTQAFGFRGSPAALVQVPAPAVMHSASVKQGMLELPEQLAHMHFFPGAPVQFGLPATSVLVTVPSFRLLKSTGSVATSVPPPGGQSRLV